MVSGPSPAVERWSSRMTLEAGVFGGGDDVVEDLEGVEAAEVGVDGAVVRRGETNIRGDDGRFDHLVGDGEADGVVAVIVNGLEDELVVLDVEAVGNGAGGLEAVPVEAAMRTGALAASRIWLPLVCQ